MEKTTSSEKSWILNKFRPMRQNDNGFFVIFPHYSCDPDKDPTTEKGREWWVEATRGMGKNDILREFEIDFQAHVGKPIIPDFDTAIHCKDMEPDEQLRLYRGWDPGWRYSVCVFLQIVDDGQDEPQARILHEVDSVSADVGVLADKVLEITEKRFAAFKNKILDDVDIAATQHSQASKYTAQEILLKKGINATYRKSGPEERILLMNHLACSRRKDRAACFLVDSRYCPRIVAACRGLYRRKQDSDRVDETEAVHYMDALGYPLVNNLHLRPKKKPKPPRVGFVENLRELFQGKKPQPDWMEI